jgi:hypothetical protein
MADVNVVTLFCEDVRQEIAGTDTIVGVMPDNVVVPQIPSLFPKLAIYSRVHIPTDMVIKSISVKVKMLDGRISLLGTFDERQILKEQNNGRATNSPLVGFIFRAVLSPAPIVQHGRITVTATIDDQEIVGGSLNVQKDQPNPSASASEQPVSQPQPASPQT